MARSDVIDINAGFSESRRTLKSGVVRTKIKADWKAPFAGVDFSSKSQRDAVGIMATTLRDIVQKQIRDVSEPAKLSTVRRRQRARKDGQSRWYRKRYAGGRTGETPPKPSVRLFNDSGRLTNIVVRARQSSKGEQVFTLNTTKNRLDPSTFRPDDFQRMLESLRRHVPALGGKFRGDDARKLQRAGKAALERLFTVAKDRNVALLKERNRALVGLVF